MTANPTSSSAIFILGIRPRSGTNFLHDLLKCHPDVSEARPFLEDFLLFGVDRLQEYVNKVSTRWDTAWGITSSDAEDLLQTLGSAALGFLENRMHDPGKRLLTKSPEVDNLGLFFKLFPKAKPILLIRDGRAVVESALRTFDTSFEFQAYKWDQAAKIIQDFRAQASPESYRLVRYEDLVADTQATLHALLEYLELDPDVYPFEAIDTLPVRGSSEVSRRGGQVHWEEVEPPSHFDPLARFEHWSDAQHRIFNFLAEQSLRAFGYAPKAVSSPHDPSTSAGPSGVDSRMDDPSYCSVSFDSFWNDPQVAILSARNEDKRCLMPHQAVSVLALVNQFQSLDHWANTFAAAGLPLEVARQLQQEFLAGGLLVSGAALQDKLRRLEPRDERPAQAARFVVIRTCERPELLQRLLHSASANLRKHGLKVIVLDDSRTELAQRENQRTVSSYRQDEQIEVLYVGSSAQQAFIQWLGAAFGEHTDTIAYALAPRPAGVFTAGRLINFANLLLAGQPYLIFDDDYLLNQQLIHAEVDTQAGFITSSPEYVMQGYTSREELLDSVRVMGTDPFAQHLAGLGRSLTTLMSSNPFDSMPPSGFLGLHQDGADRLLTNPRVITTGNGAVGRPIAPTAATGLEHQYRNTPAVWQHPKNYEAWMRGHFIYKSHYGLTLQDITQETPVAIDNSRLMPPTTPTGRREDTLFTVLIQHMHRAALHMEMPWAIQHWREERDWSTVMLEIPERISLASIMTEAMVPETQAIGANQDPGHVLRSIGALCRQFADSDRPNLEQLVLRSFQNGLSKRLQALESRLSKLPADALVVRRDIERIISVNREALQSTTIVPIWEDSHAPSHLPEQLDWAAQALSGMGNLMQLWPEMWSYCRDHHESILALVSGASASR